MAKHPDTARSAGFLLMEVAVALAIVGMTFGYGYRALSASLDRMGRDHNASAALLFAQSTLDRVGYDIALGQDDVSGNTPDGFAWSVQSVPYGPVPASGFLVGYLVRVTVGWKERDNPRQVQLTSVRLAYRGQH